MATGHRADLPDRLGGPLRDSRRPGRLHQILLNLLSDAVKCTEEGEVGLQLRVAPSPATPDDTYELHFSMQDTGIGIPKEKRDRLFESFSQVDAPKSRGSRVKSGKGPRSTSRLRQRKASGATSTTALLSPLRP
jgi:signal transduction histidine kinase